MNQPIPRNGTEPLKVGDRVQIVPEWQDPGDEKYERFVIEALETLSVGVPAGQIAAIGLCSQVNTHVFVDADGRPLLPALVE